MSPKAVGEKGILSADTLKFNETMEITLLTKPLVNNPNWIIGRLEWPGIGE